MANTGLWFELTALMASIPLLGPNKPWHLTTMNRLAPAEYAVGKKQKKHPGQQYWNCQFLLDQAGHGLFIEFRILALAVSASSMV